MVDKQGKNKENPYIGPRPFGRTLYDQLRFFGRNYETEEILTLILSHQLVLIYAQSGAGKTSILNANVIPELEKEGFKVLPIARVGVSPPSDDYVNDTNDSKIEPVISNQYMWNALWSMKSDIDLKLLSNKSLSEFLNEYFPSNDDEVDDSPSPKVIIFDQFEELFNIFPKQWYVQQITFFKQITEALNKNPYLRIVFVIREDYLAQLDPFSKVLPEKLRPRFRLERLRKDAAIQAIKGPLEKENYSFEFEEIEQIVQDLMKIKIETMTGKSFETMGEFIEPIHLQVVCQRWWNERFISKEIKSTSHDLSDLTNVDKALEDFYLNAIHTAVSQTHVKEEELRRWCEENLITSSGTRSNIHLEANITKGIPNKAIEILVDNYLIRREWRSGAAWYELTHDRLIGPIKDSNKNWMDKKIKSKKKFRIKVFVPIIIFSIIGISLYLSYLQTNYQNELEQQRMELQQKDILIAELKNEIRIGALLGLSGISSERGITQKASLEEAVKEINENFSKSKINKKVVLYIEDTELRPDVAVAKLKNLADRNIRIIIGPQTSSELNATMKYIDESKMDILLISQSSTSPSLSKDDNIFRLVPNDTKQGKEIAEKMWRDGIRLVVPMLRIDYSGNELYNAIKVNFEKLGGNVSTNIIKYNPHVGKFAGSLHRFNFLISALDVKSLSLAVSDATNYLSPNKIGVYVIAYDEIVPILIQAQSHDNLKSVNWYGSDSTARNEQLLKHHKAREFAGTTHFTNPLMALNEENIRFENLEKDTNLKELNIYDANAYDALWISALTEQKSGNTTFVKLKDNFNKIINSYQGASGTIKLDDNGDRIANYDFWTINENEYKGYEWEKVTHNQ